MRRNNIYRARRMNTALRRWHGDEREATQETIVDALADIRHLCDMRGFAFHELDKTAQNHYAEELAGNDDPNFVRVKP
jgi:hypothetical protein